MKKILAVLFTFIFIVSFGYSKTLFSTCKKQSTIKLEQGDSSGLYHVTVTGKQTMNTKDLVHVYFQEQENALDYVKSVLEKTPKNSTYAQFVIQSIKLDKTGILYWNDYGATLKYLKSGCFCEEKFYYSYDTEKYKSSKTLLK